MEHLLKFLVQHWHLSSTQYWHLRLLSSLLLGPLVGVLYLVFFDKRTWRKPYATPSPKPTMWISSDGRLIY